VSRQRQSGRTSDTTDTVGITYPAAKPVYMTTEEVADRFRTAASTVRHWRQMGTGPRGVRIGRRVLYARSAVEDWEAQLTATEGTQPTNGRPVH
jgi:predicted DNA-binding transcriptional regulator AlpA